MALTKFVRNVDDVSDDGGYKFRFRCDCCADGFESQYIPAGSNLLKTAIEVFTLFRPFGFRGGAGRRVAESVDLGLRGKERDTAYERAVHEAQAHFRKCPTCGTWVCLDHCWDGIFGTCERCASESSGTEGPASCPACGTQTRGAPFCHACGLPLSPRRCRQCDEVIALDARFCGQCGKPQP